MDRISKDGEYNIWYKNTLRLEELAIAGVNIGESKCIAIETLQNWVQRGKGLEKKSKVTVMCENIFSSLINM